jgi:hypothetical protein
VQRELPDFFIFDYKHLFRQIFWTKISVWIFHWDCNKSEFDLDVMVDSRQDGPLCIVFNPTYYVHYKVEKFTASSFATSTAHWKQEGQG